jgi:hypothetical protein
MPKTVQKTLTFPLAGVARRRTYREQNRPYAAPWAINVRGVGPLERRDRGGSRPGLTKVSSTDLGTTITCLTTLTYIDGSGTRRRDLVVIADGTLSYLRGSTITTPTSELQWPDGETMLWEDGETVVYDSAVASVNPIGATDAFHAVDRAGKLYLADSVLRVYNPATGIMEPVLATSGAVPTAQPLICLYRDRLFLSGATNAWYCCRTSEVGDWSFADDMVDVNRAVAGGLEVAGKIGSIPKAMIPFRDKALVFACENDMWVLRGDPTTGKLVCASSEVGIIAPHAWGMTADGLMAFLSNDGVYVWGVGDSDKPTRFSEERMPDQLRNVSPTTNQITMAYDPKGRGFHLFITPSTGSGTHYWLDLDNKAIWPVVLQTNHQPLAACRYEISGLAEVVFGCKDGYLRKFLASATTDDGTAINSHVLLGPIRLSANDTEDALLAEIHGIMADNSGTVTWRVMVGSSAEVVTDAAVAGITAVLAGSDPSDVAASGSWAENRNKVARPRARGAWTIVWLESSARWSYEAVAITARQLGRLR